jgi:O-antigen biosynthesis protein
MFHSSVHRLRKKLESKGVLIEARDLVNGVSIVQAESAERVEYFHVELDSHDVIIADGALAESFIDDESRTVLNSCRQSQ